MESGDKQSGNKIIGGYRNDDVQLVFIQQESVSVYEVRDSMGEVVSIVIAEGIDDAEQFGARSVAEQDAMKMLALDEYYEENE